MIQQLLFS